MFNNANVNELRYIQMMCDDKEPLYRFAAYFDNFKGKSFKDLEYGELGRTHHDLIECLKKMPLPPTDIFIYEDEIGADWIPPFPLCFDNLGEYFNVLHNFKRYIDSLDFTIGRVTTTHDDSPASLTEEERMFQKIFGVYCKGSIVKDEIPNSSNIIPKNPMRIFNFR